MNTRFYNGLVMDMQNGTQITENEIWVCEDKIFYNGKPKQTDIKWDKEINLNKNLIMPGFKNAHTHSAMTFLRSYADDLPLAEWLNNQVFPLEKKLCDEDVYRLSRLAILEYLTSGITASFDMYFFTDMVAKASLDCGFRTVLCSGTNNFSQGLSELEQIYLTHNQPDSLVSAQLGFHAEYTCDEQLLKGIAQLAHKYKAPVFTHISETKQEVQGCIQRHSQSPVQYLNSLGMFDYGGGGFHCVHFSQEDMRIFKDKNLWAVTCPASNAKLASGIAPLCDFEKLGINMAIGTDGPASNNCLDMFREMFLATSLQKLKYENAAAFPCENVLKMATVGGALAMGLTQCDTLQEGKKADLIVIDLSQPNMQPQNNIAKNLVYSGSKQNVMLTMVNGKILYQDGEFFVGCSKQEIYNQTNKILKKLTK